ncbi:MAG: right-handed parallel beta-helix repeat-containing protein [Candidatus Nanopelagicales bacterium]
MFSGVGSVSLAAGKGPEILVGSYSSTQTDARVTVSADRSVAGGDLYAAVIARGTASSGYLGRLRILPDGAVVASIARTDGSTVKQLGGERLPAGWLTPGMKVGVRVQAIGVSPTSLKLKVWKAQAAEPQAWLVESTDSDARLQGAGTTGLWNYVSGGITNGPVRVSYDDFQAGTATTAPAPEPAPVQGSLGARLPITYDLATLAGKLRYVSPSGSDSTGTGSVSAPFRTLVKAESAATNGDSIVLRGGTYPITGNAVFIDRPGLSIVAYPGELPVFDGSISAPAAVGTEGALRYFNYQPIAGGLAEGVPLSSLPVATFSGTNPTGMTAERGWRCVSGSSYSTPSPTSADPDGCSASANLITGYYPDQVWVNGKALQQVADKSRVAASTFWVSRSSATDRAPGPTRLYMSASDAGDMTKVRASSSSGTFIQIAADGVSLRGIQIQRHSPGGSHYAVVVGGGGDDFFMRDVRFEGNGGVSFKVAGGDDSSGSKLVRRPIFDHVTIKNAGFMGSAMVNADDVQIIGSRFEDVNYQKEFNRGPVSGALKASKTSRMAVSDSIFQRVWGHTLWYDQSNYDVTVARNRFIENAFSSIFFEISHGLTLVNNYIQGTSVGPGAEGHSTVRIAGSSGVKIVNNTILGGPIGIGIFADPRSKKYDSDGNGSADRWCSEHSVRYGKGGNSGTACNSPYVSDFNFSHPGAYSPSGTANQTPGLTWMPEVAMILNNVIANQAGVMADGWTPCGGKTPICVFGYLNSPAIDVDLKSIFPSRALVNGNIYQTSGSAIVRLNSRGSSKTTGSFAAGTLAALKGSAGFGSTYFGLSVESTGRSGTGYINSNGTSAPQLLAIQGQAASVPTDPKVNRYVPSGSRSYGYRG